jgi:GGDEF domain-containing protein
VAAADNRAAARRGRDGRGPRPRAAAGARHHRRRLAALAALLACRELVTRCTARALEA